MYYIVEFHADGGQMCVSGRRFFTDPEKGKQFANKMRTEPDHKYLCTLTRFHTRIGSFLSSLSPTTPLILIG